MNIEIFEENTFEYSLEVVDENKAAFNLEGFGARFSAKKVDGDDEINIDGAITNNIIAFRMTPEDTKVTPGRYNFKVVIEADGNPRQRYTIVKGLLRIKEEE